MLNTVKEGTFYWHRVSEMEIDAKFTLWSQFSQLKGLGRKFRLKLNMFPPNSHYYAIDNFF